MSDLVQQQLLKYEKYVENMKRANKKYRENNPDKMRGYAKTYYEKHKTDENFMAKKREYAAAAFLRKKARAAAAAENELETELTNHLIAV